MHNHITLLSRQLFAVFLIVSLSSCTAQALTINSEKHRFDVVTLTDELNHPWGMAFLPDGSMLITERSGSLRVFSDTLRPTPVQGLPDNLIATGQGGLLDVALHPDFANNRWVYLSYAGRGDGGMNTEVARARLNADATRLEQLEVIFRALPKLSGGRHFGSRLVFDHAGFLYITLGDRGNRERAQELSNHIGTSIRLYDDGRVPEDNPFVSNANAQPEIFTYGNRNMQGAALQPDTGLLWTHEHGPRGGDELNIMQAGANYGWPSVTYGINYSGTSISDQQQAPGITDPIYYWVPSIAPSGMSFYDGAAFPNWQGNLFIGSLKFQLLVRLELDNNQVVHEERLLAGQLGRIRAVEQGPDGLLYLLTDESRGQLLQLRPVSQ